MPEYLSPEFSLPPEMLDNVLGNFSGKDDFETLRNCSLVSRYWNPISRRHQFREVKVKKAGEYQQLVRYIFL